MRKQVDPKAESFYGISAYASMGNNPVTTVDPEGDFIFTSSVLVGMAIGAAIHTGVHLVTNDFTFNNWNWGAFAGSVVAGGVGGVVGPALEAAHIGGFYGGAILGASTGFSHNLTSGMINGDLTAGGLAKSTLLGAGIGYTLGTAIGGGDPQWLIAGGGVVLIGVAIPLDISANNKAREAVNIYNTSLNTDSYRDFKTRFYLKKTNHGVGLVLKF